MNNIKIRKSNDRGHANHGWLDSYFTFSFADYYDEAHMGYRTLRVINDDVIEAGQGFGMHGHKDMEIISYVLEGELAHKDSMGNISVIKTGNFQRMTAGTGVKHSEFNPSPNNKAHLLQIWILPEKNELTPSYQELNLADLKNQNGLILIASNQDKDGIIKIHQDVQLSRGYFKTNEKVDYPVKPGRGVWIHILKGTIEINGMKLQTGDSASIDNEKNIPIATHAESEFLLFDLK